MSQLAAIAPEFVAELRDALVGEDRPDLAQQIGAAEIERFTYDAHDDLGYLYFKRPAPSWHFAKLTAPVAHTIVFYAERGINVDVDHDGNIFGIELLGRGEIMAKFEA
jgi:uncharacterized protein YuzE